MAFTLTSPAFEDSQPIPDRHAKDGGNVSPPLLWSDPPAGTRSFALVVEDPDAPSGTFRHWLLYNIPADYRALDEGADVSTFGRGVNDFGRSDYDGPRPPKGHGAHRYRFRLAALDTERLTDVPEDAHIATVWNRVAPHVIEEAQLIGTYETR
jgi:Raf kinase inhibitor-like YbhB/YbcL family protein